MTKSFLKCLNWSLCEVELKVLIKKLTTQILCGQYKVDHYPTRRTTVPVLSIFFISAFTSPRLQVLLGNILSHRLAPYFFLFSGKDLVNTYLQC